MMNYIYGSKTAQRENICYILIYYGIVGIITTSSNRPDFIFNTNMF